MLSLWLQQRPTMIAAIKKPMKLNNNNNNNNSILFLEDFLPLQQGLQELQDWHFTKAFAKASLEDGIKLVGDWYLSFGTKHLVCNVELQQRGWQHQFT